METKANEVLTSASQQLGLGAPKLDTHYDRVSAAIRIYNTLVAKSPQDAAKFVEVMGNIGAKFAVNFGLSKPAADGKGQGVALNADKFKGLDALYQQEQKTLATGFKQQQAEAKANSGQPAPAETTHPGTSEGQSVNNPQPTEDAPTQQQVPGVPTARPTPQPTPSASQSSTAPDLRSLNVENLVRLASDDKPTITAATLAKALKVEGIPPDAAKVLKLMQAQLGNEPDSALPVADVLKSLQQIQQQQRGAGAPVPRADATQVS